MNGTAKSLIARLCRSIGVPFEVDGATTVKARRCICIVEVPVKAARVISIKLIIKHITIYFVFIITKIFNIMFKCVSLRRLQLSGICRRK